MANLKDLKKRIGTVKNTQQITKAMKMVSAAKLRRSQESIESNRPYARKLGNLISLVSGASGVKKSILIKGEDLPAAAVNHCPAYRPL